MHESLIETNEFIVSCFFLTQYKVLNSVAFR